MKKLLTKEQIVKLKSNGSYENQDQDHVPVVMLTIPYTDCVWLISEIIPEDENIGFGLCDIGQGTPELGYVNLKELAISQKLIGMPVYNNPLFRGKYPMSAYTEAAQQACAIIWNEKIVKRHVKWFRKLGF